MFNFLFSTDSHQALRMIRHMAAILALFAFTLVTFYFYHIGMFFVDKATFIYVTIFFWLGIFSITIALRSGINLKSSDPSLTIPQMLWATLYLLAISYLLNDWRGLILMPYFGMLSFGFFKLRFREFLTVSLFACIFWRNLITDSGLIRSPILELFDH